MLGLRRQAHSEENTKRELLVSKPDKVFERHFHPRAEHYRGGGGEAHTAVATAALARTLAAVGEDAAEHGDGAPSGAAEDAAKEAARKRPGHEVLGTLKSHGRKGSERASGDEHVRV